MLHRRRWRQLRELGAVEVSVACRGTELERALEEAFRLHALRWDGRHDVSTFGSELGRSFNLAALSALAARGHVRVVTLHVAGRPVAFTCSLTVAGRMYVYRLAFDPAYGHLSPGILTTLEAIRIGADEGASRVEFLRGAERYKLELADRVDPLHEAIVADGGVLPALAGYGLRARTRLRRARARVDDLARRRFRSGGCG